MPLKKKAIVREKPMRKVSRTFATLLWIVTEILFASAAHAATGLTGYLHRPDSWFSGAEAKVVASHILSFQSPLGGWPKNVNTASAPAKAGAPPLPPTFDNGATVNEMRFLALIYQSTRDESYCSAFDRGLDYILKAQYPTGGWSQSYPPDGSYHRYITFNDNSMVNLMTFIREVATEERYDFVNKDKRAKSAEAFDRGIQCILKCQIKVNGRLTAWCAQHDEIDYRPRPARAFELLSLSGAESVGIVELLMSLDHPDAATVSAIECAVAWFESAKITGHKVVEVADARSPGGKDRRLIEDEGAGLLWARFYDIASNRPIFCDRDGIVKNHFSDIGYERRNGYSWLGDWPQKMLIKDYPTWQRARK